MSSPRRVARIVHKTLRLRSRPGYGTPGSRRGRFSSDVGPEPLAPATRCDGKQPYGMIAAIDVARKLPGTEPYRCLGCNRWHVGHPPRKPVPASEAHR